MWMYSAFLIKNSCNGDDYKMKIESMVKVPGDLQRGVQAKGVISVPSICTLQFLWLQGVQNMGWLCSLCVGGMWSDSRPKTPNPEVYNISAYNCSVTRDSHCQLPESLNCSNECGLQR